MKHKIPVRKQNAKSRVIRASGLKISRLETYVNSLTEEVQSDLKAKIAESATLSNLTISDTASKAIRGVVHDAMQSIVVKVQEDAQKSFGGVRVQQAVSEPLASLAENMQQSVEALGAAMADLPEPVSPQLARSLAATERAWRDLEEEFGLLTSLQVSARLGSDPPNRTYASNQRGQGNLIAVKRPKGLLYPGYQFSTTEPKILPVMAELKSVAEGTGRSESSLALWMMRSTGYLDGNRPVDRLSEPDEVVQAAKHSFGVQW